MRHAVTLAHSTLLVALLATTAHAAPQGEPRTGEFRSALTRVREGGTPYDPSQSLVPFALRKPDDGGLAGQPGGGLIDSPPEYSPTRGVLFQYGSSWSSVVTALVSALTADTAHDEIAYVVVANQSTATSATSAFTAAGANMSKVVFIIQPTDSIWLRDYGPHFVWQEGTLGVVDSHYYPTRPNDNFVPTLVGDGTFVVPTADMGLYYSGGNFQPGPARSGFCTSLIFLNNPTSGGHDDAFVRELYDTYQGIDTLHIMPQLPTTVDATGHIDMWMYLVDENTVIISEFIAGSNSTAISITNNAVPYMQALGFEVIRPKAWNSGGVHYTYANAFRVNNRIFVPVYGTQLVAGGSSSYNDEDADAMAKWQQAAGAGVQIVPIQCYSIIPAAGAVHCIVMQVPRHTASLPTARVVEPFGDEVWLAGASQTIRWNASDTDNRALSTVDLQYSLDGGSSWSAIAMAQPDSGSRSWTVPAAETSQAMVRVVAHSVDGDTAIGVSNPFRIAAGTATLQDFASGAGANKFGYGYQTSAWTSVNLNQGPVTGALTSANYSALATSNASGGATDANRYISPTIGSTSEATHVYRFTVAQPAAQIDELRVRWEGYAANCTQVEVYAWNNALGNWGNAAGQVGQNRYLDCWAGNRDESLAASIRSNVADFIAANGSVRFLVYAERSADETYHDYMSLTVIEADDPAPACAADLDGSGSVDGADLALSLGSWGACAGCAADLDGNGSVDGQDLATLLGAWGACP